MCRKFIHYTACVLLLIGLIGVAQAADPSLVGWWKLDETSGSTAADSSGNNNTGTLVDLRSDQWVKGIKDGGLDFVPPGYINCGTGKSLNLANDADFTIAAWVKLAPNTAGNYGGIAGRLLQSGGIYTGFGLVRHSSNYFRLWVGDNTTDLAKSAVSSNTTYTDTAWHHVLGLRKGGSNYLYIDGIKQTAKSTTSFVQSTDFFHIGRQYSHLDDRYFIGVIDDVRLYNRALTDDEVRELAFAPKARDPKPADGAQGISVPLLCEWTAGTSAAFHDVYFGTNPTPGPAELVSSRQQLQLTMYFYPGLLTPGATYYWRVDEIEADGVTTYTGDVWSFTATPLTAYNPAPANGAQNVWPAVQLKWGRGLNATQHHLYLGDSFSDVDSGAASTDKGTLTENTRSSGPLAPETTYYWRVDEFDGSTWHRGDIWSFTTSIGGDGIQREYWLGAGSGLTVADLTNNPRYPDKPTGSEILSTFEGPVDWKDYYGSRLRGWLKPPETGDYTFWIASDDYSELWLSTDADPANKQMIANVPGYVPSRDFDNNNGTGGASQKSAAKSLVKGNTYYIEALMKESGGGDNIAVAWQGPGIASRQIISSKYVSLAPFLPVRAYSPRPANLATEVTDTPTLRWKAGAQAAMHNVYFGTDATAVENATTSTPIIYRGQQILDITSYVPSEAPLAWDKTYYWRIDELKGADVWKGNVWSFTTASYIIVDNFEDYTDDVGSRIFQTWKDGLGFTEPPPGYLGNGTGSMVGNAQTPYAEQNTVHNGNQSMPLGYDNSGAGGKARYSETFREWASPQNWARNNVKALTLYFYGAPTNAAEQLYVALEDDAGHIKVVNHPDRDAVQGAAWQEWNIELTQFSAAGVNLSAIKKMYIGLGNRTSPTAGGTGKIFIDDIRVHPSRCVPSKGKPTADLSGNCVVNAADMEVLANLWLNSGFQITPVNPGTTGLIAKYPFDGNTNDIVGGHNGTIVGSPTYTTGKIGQAILLNGVDQMVDVGAVGISGAAARTIAGWAKANATPASLPDWINIFGFTGPSGNYGHFDIELVNVSNVRGYGIHVYGWERNIMPMDLEWHHLAATYDGTTTKWYGDGRLVNSDSTLVLSTPDNVHMGKRDDNENYFPGRIDEVCIYNRALSGPEIAWLAGYTAPFSIAADLQQDNVIDFKDFAKLADSWLEELLWP